LVNEVTGIQAGGDRIYVAINCRGYKQRILFDLNELQVAPHDSMVT
jgi:hypothetical protein